MFAGTGIHSSGARLHRCKKLWKTAKEINYEEALFVITQPFANIMHFFLQAGFKQFITARWR